jgi:3-phenylpropionate/trans-cinnamate dioxygenase ferredoxin reductase subunit
MNARPLVIVGGGQAGFTLATRLRDLGDRRRIVLVDGEGTAPYSRPPLSKEYLVATKAAGDLLFRPESYYAAQDIELRLGVTATGIDPGTRTVTLSGGDVLGYADLVLCTGAEPRTLPLAGCDEVVTVYRREDTDRLRTILAVANSIVCIGGGFIGLEVAAAAAKHNVHTTVVEVADRVMARLVSPEVSRHYEGLHREAGNQIRLGVSVTDLRRGADGLEVVLSDGTTLTTDAVVVGVGAVPRTELAVGAGLAVGRGIVVDEELTTSDPRIRAIGDCAELVADGTSRLLSSVQNATDQARHLAAVLAGNAPGAYREVPWFWSDQLGSKLQIAGLADAVDRYVTRRTEPGKFTVFGLRDEVVVAAESVSRPGDHIAVRALMGAGRALTVAEIEDPDVDLRALAKAANAAARLAS